MTATYTEEQRGFAKALTLAGDTRSARETLLILAAVPDSEWPEAPSKATLAMWKRNPKVVPATEILEQFGRELQLTIGAQMRTLLEPLRARILRAIKDSDATPADIHNLTKSYALLVDKVMPREARAAPSTIITGPTQITAPGATGIMRLFGPKDVEPPSTSIEVEAEAAS